MVPSFRRSLVAVALVLLFTACSGPATRPDPVSPPATETEKAEGADKAVPAAKKLVIAADVDKRLAQFAPTDVDFDEKLIKPAYRKVLVKLVQAAKILDDIYLDQVSPDNRALRAKLVAQKAPQVALDYFDLMYGPWDRLEGDKPFVGSGHKPHSAGFYPADLTKEQLEAWIKAHPDQEKAFRGYFTVIRRQGDKLVAVPYSEAYKARLAKAAKLLREAAKLSPHKALSKYLELRAAAFASNDYFDSDMAWMDLGDSPLEVVVGPYEVYEDRLMGYKAAFEAFINLRDPVYSARLQKLAKYNTQVERNLPLPKKYFTKRGTASPISVVIELFTAGDTRAGVQTAAFNLPNDERVRTKKGSKKVMLKNVTEAKFNKVLVPIAKRIVDEKLISSIDFDTYFTDILLHEMAHGMGPGQITVGGKKTTVNRALKELYPHIEECKADITGLVNGVYLIKKRALPKAMAKKLPATYLAGVFRATRFGTEEAHGKAVLVAFNYLRKGGAFTYDAKTKRFSVDYTKFDKVVRALAGELLMLQAKGSYADAKKLIETYGKVSPEMKQALASLKGVVPVDIRPNYTILTKMKSW
jgi:hypothetical protein